MPTTEQPTSPAEQLAQQGRQMEQSVREAVRELKARHQPDVDRFADAAASMARMIRSSLEQQAAVVSSLTEENAHLRRALDRLRVASQDDDADTRWFGAHLRQTWRELRGR